HVALHVGHEHRHADAREALGQRHQRDRLAGAGGAGDEAVAVAVARLQDDAAAALGQRVGAGDGLADEDRVHGGSCGCTRDSSQKPAPRGAGRGLCAGARASLPCRIAVAVRGRPEMPPQSCFLRRLLLAVAVAVLASHAPDASAQSRRDRAAAAGLAERMAAAEARYQEARVRAANADPGAVAEADAALEDMEDILLACEKQRGCQLASLLPGVKRQLKANVDEAAGDPEDDLELEPEGDLPTGDVPEGASAAALLGEDGQRFV